MYLAAMVDFLAIDKITRVEKFNPFDNYLESREKISLYACRSHALEAPVLILNVLRFKSCPTRLLWNIPVLSSGKSATFPTRTATTF
jgi:hypothetical protein